MTTQIFPDIFQIQVPLPSNPLGHINSYLIRSEKKNLLVDTGMNFSQPFKALCQGLSDAEVERERLDEILVTHFHVDHVGLIPRLKQAAKNVKLLIHRKECELSKLMVTDFENFLKSITNFLESNGAPSALAVNFQRFHPAFSSGQAYQELAENAFPIEDGQQLLIGDYSFEVIWTPGHSPGHVCLYEPTRKILFSGDHLLPSITSHIAQSVEASNPLTDYLASLRKIEKLDVKTVLPAHEEVFSNFHERIEQLENHHQLRLNEILHALKDERVTAYTLAAKISWDISCESWNAFPPFQKYLALGETIAHLNLLEQRGLVRRIEADRIFLYQKTN